MRHFLQYWKVDQADSNQSLPLDHAVTVLWNLQERKLRYLF